MKEISFLHLEGTLHIKSFYTYVSLVRTSFVMTTLSSQFPLQVSARHLLTDHASVSLQVPLDLAVVGGGFVTIAFGPSLHAVFLVLCKTILHLLEVE